MQTEQVLITCDVCGAQLAVPKHDAASNHYTLPMLKSVDIDPSHERIESLEVDLCYSCLRKAAVIRAVTETVEAYVGWHDVYGRKPTGRIKYGFIEEEE